MKQTENMKKLLVTIVMLMGVSASTSFAHDYIFVNNIVKTDVKSDLSVKALEGLKFKVTAFNLAEKAIVELKDKDGDVLYKEVITETAFAKILDMASLPDGSYTIVLTTGGSSVKKPFEITTSLVRNAVALSK
jgi:methionine-rich copper-binding protein CopC